MPSTLQFHQKICSLLIQMKRFWKLYFNGIKFLQESLKEQDHYSHKILNENSYCYQLVNEDEFLQFSQALYHQNQLNFYLAWNSCTEKVQILIFISIFLRFLYDLLKIYTHSSQSYFCVNNSSYYLRHLQYYLHFHNFYY